MQTDWFRKVLKFNGKGGELLLFGFIAEKFYAFIAHAQEAFCHSTEKLCNVKILNYAPLNNFQDFQHSKLG